MFRLRPLFSRARSTLAIGAFELPAAAPPGPTVLQRVNAFAKAQPLAVSIVGARPPDSGAILRKYPVRALRGLQSARARVERCFELDRREPNPSSA